MPRRDCAPALRDALRNPAWLRPEHRIGDPNGYMRHVLYVDPDGAFVVTAITWLPGQVSPVVQTKYGFHIIKVDRAKPSEVKARHILIKPEYTGEDTLRARMRADSALALWKSGTVFDSLVKRFHDTDEFEGSLEPFPRENLPESYKTAIGTRPKGDFVGPFPIEDRSRGVPKYVVLQLTDVIEAGDYTVEEVRDRMRNLMSQERSFRRLIDHLQRVRQQALQPA